MRDSKEELDEVNGSVENQERVKKVTTEHGMISQEAKINGNKLESESYELSESKKTAEKRFDPTNIETEKAPKEEVSDKFPNIKDIQDKSYGNFEKRLIIGSAKVMLSNNTKIVAQMKKTLESVQTSSSPSTSDSHVLQKHCKKCGVNLDAYSNNHNC